jgi:DNA-binding NtrC family response regulator
MKMEEGQMARIFIVDDDADFLEACKSILVREGYTVESANNVKDAEERIKEGDYDLIMLDIMMEQPDDGISLAHRLKKQGVEVPVIMMSGVSKVTGYQYGKCDDVLPCMDFIEKPVTPDTLLSKVKTYIEK